MTTVDPFAHFDGAYVLGSLDPDEHAAFEDHLATCALCRARVEEVRGVPALLAGLPLEAFEPTSSDDLPDTLLPSLLRRAGAERRRRRTVTAALAGLAAACLVALTVVLWPSPSTSTSGPAPVAMKALVSSPVTATATVRKVAWGTQIELTCTYRGTALVQGYGYHLVVVDTSGTPHELGTWKLVPDRTVHYTSGTALTREEIASISINTPADQPILQLTL